MTRALNITVNAVKYAVLGLLLCITLGNAAFLAFGGRLYDVETPSMATYAPVGTLVFGVPTKYDEVKIGQTLLFHPPKTQETYFHRVQAIDATGISTQGDLNGTPDPWRLKAQNVIASELFRVPYLGWLVKALPIIAVGGLVLLVFAYVFQAREYRFYTFLYGWAGIFAIANFFVRPFFRSTGISQVVVDGELTSRFVNTGILPISASINNGTSVIVQPGEIGTLTSKVANAGQFVIHMYPSLAVWMWVIAGALMMLPLILSVVKLIALRLQDNQSDRVHTLGKIAMLKELEAELDTLRGVKVA